MNELKKKLTNTKVILAIVAQIGIIVTTLGLDLDWNLVTTIVVALLEVLTLAGILTNKGMDTDKWDV